MGAASIKVAVTVGGNALLTFGKEIESISAHLIVGEEKKEKGKLNLSFYSLPSTIFAIGAFFLTDSIPFAHASLDV